MANDAQGAVDKIEKRVSLALAVAAFSLSLYNFASDHLFAQHRLRAAVISLGDEPGFLTAKLLVVNAGKHDETLYSARFLFAGTTYGKSTAGPFVLKPGEARVESLREPAPSIKVLRDEGVIPPNADHLHIAVDFLPVTRDGTLEERSTVYGFTNWTLSGEEHVGSVPAKEDKHGLVELKL